MPKVFKSLYVVKRCSRGKWKPVACFLSIEEAAIYADDMNKLHRAPVGTYVPFEAELPAPLYL